MRTGSEDLGVYDSWGDYKIFQEELQKKFNQTQDLIRKLKTKLK